MKVASGDNKINSRLVLLGIINISLGCGSDVSEGEDDDTARFGGRMPRINKRRRTSVRHRIII